MMMMKGYLDEVYSSVTQRESSIGTLSDEDEDRDWGIVNGGGVERSNR